jgi:DNA helicase-2/ATP-dependent DNA helicase PcrA
MLQQNAKSAPLTYLVAAEELHSNYGQWEFYESHGNCVALAGPGSGKTKMLTIKLARILAEDIRLPRGVACLTYNNECVREIKRRLAKLGVNNKTNLFVGTIHSFCFEKILIPYSKMAGLGLSESLRVASQSDQRNLFANANNAVFQGATRRSSRSEMDLNRRTYIDRASSDWRVDQDPVFNVIEAYERELRINGLIDFDDMMLLGLKLVNEHEWIRKILKARFPIIIIDEYQDLGLPLHKIAIDLCFKAGSRLLAVGDPNQSIYGFTGAKPELLYELAAQNGIKRIDLELNYRCGKTIVKASEIVLGLKDGQFNTPISSPEGSVEIHKFPNGIKEQAEKICEEIIPNALKNREGRNMGDIAVLYLDKNDGDVIAEAAQKKDFQYIRIDGNAPYQKTPLTRWLEDCAAWCVNGWRIGEPKLSSLVQTWLWFNSSFEYSSRQTLELKRKLVKFLWLHRDVDASLESWLKDMDVECLQDTFFPDCNQQDEYDTLEKLLSACSSGGKIENFSVKTFSGQLGAPTHLNLITLHSAKGLEFDVVIMMGMDQGRIPWVNDNIAKRAEKRRLFYVGLTRAKYEVHLTYSGWYRDQYDRIKYDGPSEFLRDLSTHDF